jgi:hypothetical protein
MDKNNIDYNNFFGGFSSYPNNDSVGTQYADFNPSMQYEQGYMYYRFLTQQLEYKIKCKEFEKLCNERNEVKNERRMN